MDEHARKDATMQRNVRYRKYFTGIHRPKQFINDALWLQILRGVHLLQLPEAARADTCQLDCQYSTTASSMSDFNSCRRLEVLSSSLQIWMRPVAEELYSYTLLQAVLSGLSPAYIVVDAIDELSVSGQIRQTLQSNLDALRYVHTVNLMMTSRFIPQITQELRDPLCLETRSSDEDVSRYAQRHIDDLAKCFLKDPQLQENMVDFILNAIDGMFLLAQLHMDS